VKKLLEIGSAAKSKMKALPFSRLCPLSQWNEEDVAGNPLFPWHYPAALRRNP
jgi:hypothetical protein